MDEICPSVVAIEVRNGGSSGVRLRPNILRSRASGQSSGPPGLVEKARFSRCFTFNLSPPHVDCGRCERSWHTAMLIEVSAHCLLGHGGQSRSYGGPPAAEELLRRPHLAPRRPLLRPATEDLYMAVALSDDPSSFRRLLGASEGGLWMVSLGPERPSYVGTCIWMSCGTFLHVLFKRGYVSYIR